MVFKCSWCHGVPNSSDIILRTILWDMSIMGCNYLNIAIHLQAYGKNRVALTSHPACFH